MLWRLRPDRSSPRLYLVITAVILGLVSVPVECSQAMGPHSLYQPPPMDTAAGTTPRRGLDGSPEAVVPVHDPTVHTDHSHHLMGLHESGFAANPAPSAAPSPIDATTLTATAVTVAASLMGMSGGVDRAVPIAGAADGLVAAGERRAALVPDAVTAPHGHVPRLDPPPPKTNSPI